MLNGIRFISHQQEVLSYGGNYYEYTRNANQVIMSDMDAFLNYNRSKIDDFIQDDQKNKLEINIEFIKYRSFLFLEKYLKTFKNIKVSYN